MAKAEVNRREIEVTLTLTEDEALALLALVGQVEAGNRPVVGIYKTLGDVLETQVPSIYAYSVRAAGGGLVPTIKVVKNG